MLLFVTGLMDDMDDVDLKEMFELYGQVDTARVIYDKFTKKSRGFGFIEMPNDDEAKEVIGLFNNVSFGRRKLTVQKAEQQTQQNSGPKRRW
jgi:RNA recognition motif-containing protein